MSRDCIADFIPAMFGQRREATYDGRLLGSIVSTARNGNAVPICEKPTHFRIECEIERGHDEFGDFGRCLKRFGADVLKCFAIRLVEYGSDC